MTIAECLNKNEPTDNNRLANIVSNFQKADNILRKHIDIGCSENPIYTLMEMYLGTVELIHKMILEPKINEVNHLQSKISYTIFPDGKTYATQEYNHDGFYLRWLLENDSNKFEESLILSNQFLTEKFYYWYGSVEFCYCGDYGAVNLIDGMKLSKQQKEKLIQIYEINGIANRYFEEVEQV